MTQATLGNGWDTVAVGEAWPLTWDARWNEYRRRWSVYQGGPYSQRDHERLSLFQDVNASGTVRQRTRRICTMLAFIADVDASAIATGIALNVSREVFPVKLAENGSEIPNPAGFTALEAGNEVWRRSAVRKHVERWARMLSVAGDLHIEAMLDESGQPVITAHRADQVRVWYDRYGRELARAEIEFSYRKPGRDEPIAYKRVITPETIETTDDGKTVSEPNPVGAVTLVHVPFKPMEQPEFSANAWHGNENAVAVADSARTMMQAIGIRHSAPWLVTTGAQMDENDQAAASVARTLALPANADAKYLEASQAGINAYVQLAESVLTDAERRAPEHLFTEAGANISGTALTLLASSFVAKIEPVRAAFRIGLARATGLALALANRQRWSEAADMYEVTGGPALPADRRAELDLLVAAIDGRLLKQSDAVRAAQGFGLVPTDADPIVYASEVAAESQQQEQRAVDAAARIVGARVQADSQAPDAVPAPAAAVEPVGAMNGKIEAPYRDRP